MKWGLNMRYIIIFLIIVICLIILNKMYKKTNHYKNIEESVKIYTEGIPMGLEIVNTGSSYARYALDYNYTSLKGVNFALQPQSLSYDFRILKQYTKHLKKQCIVLITLPDLVFGFVEYKGSQSNLKYYHFLKPEFIFNYSKLIHFLECNFPLLANSKNIFKIIKDAPKDGLLLSNSLTLEEVQIEAKARINGWKKEFNISNTEDSKFPVEVEDSFIKNREIVSDMIKHCKESGFIPVIFIPPTSSYLNELITDEFINKMLYDNIKKANILNIPVLDYLNDERFQKHELYINSDFLNMTGRLKMTKIIIEDLTNMGLIRGIENE